MELILKFHSINQLLNHSIS